VVDEERRGLPAVWETRAQRNRRLSPREREVVRLIAGGLSGRQAAERLGVSPATVRALATSARQRLGVGEGVMLANWLAERGGTAWVDGHPARPRPRHL
jgi:non-specific serine/threonine protein kinase